MQEYDRRCPLCRAPHATSAAESLRRLQTHADKGNAEAQVVLGDHYRVGALGLKINLKRAFKMYELAAAQGQAAAQDRLCLCYNYGSGVEINPEASALWMRRAADQGYPNSQYNIGNEFFYGKGVAQSYDEALKWYRLAAAQGLPNAMYYLAMCYEHGFGVP